MAKAFPVWAPELAAAVEIGNSRLKFGLFRGARLIEAGAWPLDRLPERFEVVRGRRGDVARAAVASVVPSRVKAAVAILHASFGVKPVVVTSSSCGMKTRLREPGAVGVDRLLAAKAAFAVFGGPVIVVSVGTAVTVDRVSRKGVFEGGAIMPGPELWLRSLTATALLPGVLFDPGARLPGRDTREAIAGGCRFGIAGAIAAAIEAQKGRAASCRVAVTGGWSSVFNALLPGDVAERPFLALEGLGLLLAGE